MILVAYAFLIVAVVAYSRDSVASVPPRLELLARALGAVTATGFVGIALLLLDNAPPVIGTTVLLLLALGASVYLCGLVRWEAPAGFALRRAGWFSMLAALAFPSTLTLLIPVACLLVLTLRPASQRQTRLVRLTAPIRR